MSNQLKTVRPIVREMPDNLRPKGKSILDAGIELPRVPEKFMAQDILVSTDGVLPLVLLHAYMSTVSSFDDVALSRLVFGGIISASALEHGQLGLNGYTVSSVAFFDRLVDFLEEKERKERAADNSTEKEDDVVSSSASLPDGWTTCLPAGAPGWLLSLPISCESIEKATGIDKAELAAFAGVLLLASTKTPTANNIAAFNANRIGAVSSLTMDENLKIFNKESKVLTLEKLRAVAAVLNLNLGDRAKLVYQLVATGNEISSGPKLAFDRMFSLLNGAGLTVIRMCLAFLHKYDQFLESFPEMYSEVITFSEALTKFEAISPKFRNHYKAIFGEKYAPIRRDSVNRLTAIARYALLKEDERWANFSGYDLSDDDKVRVNEFLEKMTGKTSAPVEEAVEEA